MKKLNKGRHHANIILFNFVFISLIVLFLGGSYYYETLSQQPLFSQLSITRLMKKSLQPKECKRQNNIVFVKTHKCASSTIQNMLMRYADEQNLTIVLPLSIGENYLSKTKPFTQQSIAKAPWSHKGYNILCHHILYNHKEVQKIMPKDTLYFTTLREPTHLFESLYSYVHFEKHLKKNFEQFANTATKSFPRINGHLGTNQMSFDLGINEKYFDNLTRIRQEIGVLESRFDLIMIAEHFDESIVLLKDILCWDWDQVVTFKLNSRKESKKHNLSKNAMERLRKLNAADVLLYEHFKSLFSRKVADYGAERMKADIETLKAKRKEWFDYCIQGIYDSTKLSKDYKLYSPDVWGFEVKKDVNNETCDNLATAELQQTIKMQRKQLLKSLPLKLRDREEYISFILDDKGPVPDLKLLTSSERTRVVSAIKVIHPYFRPLLPKIQKPVYIRRKDKV